MFITVGNTTSLFKLEMRLQYTFVIVNQDKQIPSNFFHFTYLFLQALRGINWYSAVIVFPEDNYNFRNNIHNINPPTKLHFDHKQG